MEDPNWRKLIVLILPGYILGLAASLIPELRTLSSRYDFISILTRPETVSALLAPLLAKTIASIPLALVFLFAGIKLRNRIKYNWLVSGILLAPITYFFMVFLQGISALVESRQLFEVIRAVYIGYLTPVIYGLWMEIVTSEYLRRPLVH